MKCPACGYHNPPGISGCARCGPSGPACAVPEAGETFYPPRARDLTTGQRLARFASCGFGDRVAPGWSVRLHEVLCSVVVTLAALVPGLAQALQGRWRRAAQLAAACGVLTALLLLLVRNPASDTALGLLLLLQCVSVGEVVAHRHPPLRSNEVDDMRAVLLGWTRIALLSCSVVAMALAVGFWALGQEYTPWNVTTNWLGATFREGDTLLVQRPPRWIRNLRRGQVVTLEDVQGPGLERVLALPGDRIAVGASGLRVNGALTAGAPRTVYGGSSFNSQVSGDMIAISAEAQAGNPVRMVPFAAVRGRVVAILEPAGRRCWVR